MTTSKARNIIAIALVAAFIVVTVVPLILLVAVEAPKDWPEIFEKFWTVWSGIMGGIVGYYFGSSKVAKRDSAKSGE